MIFNISLRQMKWMYFILLKSETSRRLSLSKAEAMQATATTSTGSVFALF